MKSVFLEVLEELGLMFFGTPRMALPLLVLIALVALLVHLGHPQVGGGLLLIGCLALLAENVFYTARNTKPK